MCWRLQPYVMEAATLCVSGSRLHMWLLLVVLHVGGREESLVREDPGEAAHAAYKWTRSGTRRRRTLSGCVMQRACIVLQLAPKRACSVHAACPSPCNHRVDRRVEPCLHGSVWSRRTSKHTHPGSAREPRALSHSTRSHSSTHSCFTSNSAMITSRGWRGRPGPVASGWRQESMRSPKRNEAQPHAEKEYSSLREEWWGPASVRPPGRSD